MPLVFGQNLLHFFVVSAGGKTRALPSIICMLLKPDKGYSLSVTKICRFTVAPVYLEPFADKWGLFGYKKSMFRSAQSWKKFHEYCKGKTILQGDDKKDE